MATTKLSNDRNARDAINALRIDRGREALGRFEMNRKIFDVYDQFHQADRDGRRLADLADRGDVVAKAILARRARLGRYAAVASATGRFATGTVPSSLRTKLARLAEDRAAFDRAHRRTDA